MGWPSEEKLAREMASRVSHIDKEVALEFYRELVRHIMANIREKGYISLPRFGTFSLKTRRGAGATLGSNIEHRYLKFSVSKDLRDYIKKMFISKEADKRSRGRI